MEDRIREILSALVDDSSARPHLDPLRARLPSAGAPSPREGALAAVQRELAAEVAGSLGRAGRRVEESLARLEAIGRALDAAEHAGDTASRSRLVADHSAERARALGYLRDLKIQREALGFRRHEDVARLYPVPPPRR